MLNLIKEQDNIDNLYAKDLSERKYEFLIKKCEDVGTKHFNDPNAFIECSNTMDGVYQKKKNYNPSRKFQAIIKELFSRCRKVNISLVFITVLFFSSKRCEIKFNILFDYENPEQQKITKYCN